MVHMSELSISHLLQLTDGRKEVPLAWKVRNRMSRKHNLHLLIPKHLSPVFQGQ